MFCRSLRFPLSFVYYNTHSTTLHKCSFFLPSLVTSLKSPVASPRSSRGVTLIPVRFVILYYMSYRFGPPSNPASVLGARSLPPRLAQTSTNSPEDALVGRDLQVVPRQHGRPLLQGAARGAKEVPDQTSPGTSTPCTPSTATRSAASAWTRSRWSCSGSSARKAGMPCSCCARPTTDPSTPRHRHRQAHNSDCLV